MVVITALLSSQVQSGLANDGQDTPTAGQVASLTSCVPSA